VAVLGAICVGLPGAGAAQDVMTFAVPPEGASGYLIAAGYSKVISAKTSIKKVIMQPFSSATAWPVRMNAGEVNFAQHCGYEQILEAYRGTGPFKSVGPQRNIRNLATSYGLPWSVHAVDPAIKTFADLKRRSLFVQVSHTDHIIALQHLLKSAGLDYNRDIRVLPFREPTEAVQGIASGRGDAIAFGLIPSLVELHRSKGMHSLPISSELAAQVKRADPVWGVAVIRKGTGPLAPPEDVPVLAIECGMAAAAQTNPNTVYEVMKAVYDNLNDWKGVHPLANQTTLKKALDIVVVPFHEGAIRFYKEAGLWNPELDAKQQELLKQ
jgi:TRAP transporter TAXI family solute receptor